MPSMPTRAARSAVATKSARTLARPASSSASGASSSLACGTVDGASDCCSAGSTPCGRRIWIATLIGDARGRRAARARQRFLVGVAVEAEVDGRDAFSGETAVASSEVLAPDSEVAEVIMCQVAGAAVDCRVSGTSAR